MASLRHGLYSERAIAARAEQVHHALLEVAPWLAEDRYLPSVNRYLQATAREQLAHEALLAAPPAKMPRLLEACTAAARLAWQEADALGLTPAGHAKLKMLVAGGEHAEASLADVRANGRAALERRRQAIAAGNAEPPTPAQEAPGDLEATHTTSDREDRQ